MDAELIVSQIKTSGLGNQAGLLLCDVIKSYDDQEVTTLKELRSAIAHAKNSLSPNSTVEITVQRNREKIKLSVGLGDLGVLFPSQIVKESPKKLISGSQDPMGVQKVIVADVSMPFMSMVVFMVKWALASIPAFIILAIIISLLTSLFR